MTKKQTVGTPKTQRLRIAVLDVVKDRRNRLDKAIHRMADNIRRTDDPRAAYVLSQQLSVLTSSRVLTPGPTPCVQKRLHRA